MLPSWRRNNVCTVFKVVLYLLRALALLLVIGLVLGVIYLYIPLDTQIGFLAFKQHAIATGWYMPGFYMHVIGAPVILVAGSLQFWPFSRQQPTLHRALGYVYVWGVLLLAAPGGLVMTFFVDRGPGVLLSFLVQSTLWVLSTVMAFSYAVKGNFKAHAQQMRYSYALAFAAVTLRVYIRLFTGAGFAVNTSQWYLLIALLSWVPNVLIALLINQSRLKVGPKS